MSLADRRWSGLALSQILALGLFAACLWWVAREVEIVLASDRILSSLSVERALGSTLGRQIAVFAVAALLVHALAGLLAFALARLTEAAFPGGILASRHWLVAGWFAVLAGLAFAANAALFPASVFAGVPEWWRTPVAGLPPVALAAGSLGALVALLAIKAASTGFRFPRPDIGVVATVAVIALSLSGLWLTRTHASGIDRPAGAPHIVILGIDSLRNDLTVPRHGPADTPHVRAFLAGSRRFEDATTPLARTYASWVSILTGRHPVTTNARYNLMPRRLVTEGETLADSLRSRGYRAVYATDEARFANIDTSFGFDQLVTPPIGAIDFLLGSSGDLPLVNLVAATPAGRWVFPSNHANRGASVTYRPRDFVRRLEREIEIDSPTFLAIHLTLAHWPYAWAGEPMPSEPEEYRQAYGKAVHEVDRQFAEVLRVLGAKGVLENAIVVLLSDHGEALGADNDSVIRETGTSREIWDSIWGHGTSVLSPNQYQVLLAMRAYGRAKLPGPSRNYDWPVSLEDLRPTLEEVATGKAARNVDGISLVPFMAEPEAAVALSDRVRFTETDFNTASILAGRFDASGIVDEASVYYELDPDTAWVQMRASRLPELMVRKQRAALTSDGLLAAIPGPASQGVRYLYSDRRSPRPRGPDGPDAAFRDPEARRLQEALQRRFAGELPASP